MSKATATRIARTFEVFESYTRKSRSGKSEVIIPAEVLKRETPKEAQPREARECFYCHRPMMVSAGQVAYFHKACRKKQRSRRGQGKKGLR